jgi:hypothetical protein
VKDLLRSFMPDHHTLRQHRALAFLGTLLHDPQIFHLTRHSAAGGMAAGLFCAFFPIPGHMIFAAIAAIGFRVNLPVAVAAVWVTNPITIPPIFYLAYRLGSAFLDNPVERVHFEFTLKWLTTTFVHIWPALATGSLILAITSASLGYAGVRLLWRLAVVMKVRERRRRISSRGQESRGQN